MSEDDWLTGTDARVMLDFLRGKVSDRKLRLFACACCRRVWDSLTLPRSRRAVETAEQYADGLATEKDLHRARSLACQFAPVGEMVRVYKPYLPPRWWLAAEAVHFHQPFLIGRLRWHPEDDALNAWAPVLLRDLVGNPFRPVSFDPAWRTDTVAGLAHAAYERRSLPGGELDPVRLAILADALEEAGCVEWPILHHLRQPGPHLRGCWVVDLLTGRA